MSHIIIKSSTHHHLHHHIGGSGMATTAWESEAMMAQEPIWRASHHLLLFPMMVIIMIQYHTIPWREDCSLKKTIFLSPLSSPFIGELFCQRSSSCPCSLVVLWPLIGFHKVFPKCKWLTLHRSPQLMFFGEKLKIYGLLTPRLVCKKIRLNVARFSWTKNSQDAAFKEIAVNF